MGRRGPPPKPTILKQLAGNPGKRKLNDAEPKPTPGAPTMPGWLSREAKAEWRRVVPELEAVGMLSVVDRSALAAYCQAYADFVAATQLLNAEGPVIEQPVFDRAGVRTGSIKRKHPATALQREASSRMKQFLGEFGLTPSSRSRLQVPGPAEADPFEDFLRNSGSPDASASA